jgi:hypothetical protein
VKKHELSDACVVADKVSKPVAPTNQTGLWSTGSHVGYTGVCVIPSFFILLCDNCCHMHHIYYCDTFTLV